MAGPEDVRLFEELTAAGADSVAHLVPASLAGFLADPLASTSAIFRRSAENALIPFSISVSVR